MKLFKTIKRQVLVIVLFGLACFVYALSAVTVKAANITVNGIDIVYTNPGEDCSTSVIISWHSNKMNCDLKVTTADDTNFTSKNVYSVTASGKYDDSSFVYYDVASFYKFSVTLTDLTPDTDYIYKIICGNKVSDVRSFKTAGASEFTFGYMSDIHAVNYDNLDLGMKAVDKLKVVQALVDNTEKTLDTKLSFIMTTGDEVWRGSQYSNWQEWSKNDYVHVTNDYLWLSCPGNHEYYTQCTDSVWNYYPNEYANNTGGVYSDPQYFYNTYFNAIKSVPKNGADGVSSSYWTLYNNVLFICIDSMQGSEYGKLKDLRNWFENVVNMNDGNYQYLITYQHYPWYDFQTGADKYANKWNDLFDKYGVDLALSGHMHGYLRTKSLYDGKVCEEEGKGTVYVVSPQVGDRPKQITDYQNEELMAARESTVKWTKYSAMSAIKVTKEGLTYSLVDYDGVVRDSFTVKARRSASTSDKAKTQVINSLSFSSTLDTITCDVKSNLASYVDNVKISVDGKAYRCYPSTKKVSYVTAKDLESNKLYEVEATITFTDGDTYKLKQNVLTTNEYNFFKKATANSSATKMTLNWEVTEGVAKNYKVYLDGQLLDTVSTNSIDVDIKKVSFDSKYTIEAYNESGKLIYTTDFYYMVYGDVNLDGKADTKDVNALIDYIFNGYKFSTGAIKLLDNNKDNIVDIGDAFRILSYANSSVSAIVEDAYEVTFVDMNGVTIDKQKVLSGSDATYPEPKEVEGYTFAGWSKSNENITGDMIIRAYYTKNN